MVLPAVYQIILSAFMICLAPGKDSILDCIGVVLNTGTLLPLSGQWLTQEKIALILHLELVAALTDHKC